MPKAQRFQSDALGCTFASLLDSSCTKRSAVRGWGARVIEELGACEAVSPEGVEHCLPGLVEASDSRGATAGALPFVPQEFVGHYVPRPHPACYLLAALAVTSGAEARFAGAGAFTAWAGSDGWRYTLAAPNSTAATPVAKHTSESAARP